MLGSVRILDLTWVLGGPFAGQLLAQLGAEVIKIEGPGGDLSRAVPPHFFEGDSAFYLSVNRGKRGIAIDLKHPDGLATFYDLVRNADAVVYGFAPDVPKRLGIDFETLSRINPKIVVAELIGLHDEGDYARAPAYDLIVQALGGIMSITGEAGGAPARVGYQIGDLAAGLYLALAVAGGLVKSAREGKGSRVQISLLDCQIALLTWHAQNFLISGEVPSAIGSRNAVLAPSEVYRCADGRYLAVSPTGDHFWRKFCAMIGRPDFVDDPRYATRAARIQNVDSLSAALGDIFARKTAKEWTDEFFAERIPAASVLSVEEALTQPVSQLRGMVEEAIKPESGNPMKFVGNPFKYPERQPLSYPPSYGTQTNAVLREVCGYGNDKIQSLIGNKAIFEGASSDKTV
ncbi:MAG TPA: CoA transferase [Xanthobacteraceae bacterium]|nr:CoA transferase [Xanthobacteraceae bacterium]